jgi:uncharacterized membrane protein YkoI
MATLLEAQEHKGQQDIKKAIGAAKVTLAQAIDSAQKEVAGGKVIEAWKPKRTLRSTRWSC